MTNPTNPPLDAIAERLQRVLSADSVLDGTAGGSIDHGATSGGHGPSVDVRPQHRRSMFTSPSHPGTAVDVRPAVVASAKDGVGVTNTPASLVSCPVVVADVPGAFLPYDSQMAQATLHGQIDRVYRLCYRTAYRLLGRRQLAEAVAADAVRSVVGQPQLGPPARLAIGYVLETILAHYGELRATSTGDSSAVVHAEHRDRLVRELRRNSPSDRLILAVRHLGGLGVDDTAVIVGRSVGSVGKVTSRWTPGDDLDPAGELITNLDAWTPPENPGQSEGATLAHLDDPLVGVQPAVRGVADLPPQTITRSLTAIA